MDGIGPMGRRQPLKTGFDSWGEHARPLHTNERKAMRKVFASLALLGLLLAGVTLVAPSASANATTGNHATTLSCEGSSGRVGTLTVYYNIYTSGSSSWRFRLSEVLWETSPAFEADAVQLYVEATPGNYSAWGPAMGGSSGTQNDVPTWWNRVYPSYWDNGLGSNEKGFQNTDTPALRLSAWGVGQGSSTTTCDDYKAMA